MTTAALLVTVAVSAVSGCVSVAQPSVRESASPTAPPSAHRGSAPRAVEAPAREALRMMDPSPSAAPGKPSSGPKVPEQGGESGPAADSGGAGEDRSPGPGEALPPGKLPVGGDLPGQVLPTPSAIGAELCALGRAYGGWPRNSPQAQICTTVYRR